MKARDLVPPVLARFGAALRRSLATDFKRGLDSDDALNAPTRLSQPYAQSGFVHAAVNHITGELAGLPIKFYAGDEEFEDPAFEAFWDNPALGPRTCDSTARTRLALADVIRDLAAWAKLEGEFFLLFDDSWLLATGRTPNSALRTPFLIAVPSRISLIIQGGALAGYRYSDAAGRQSTWLPEQVVHWKAFNPYDDWRGLGSLQAAIVAAEASYHTGTYIRELMRNNGDQGFIIAAKHGVADQAQREQIIADLRAKRAALRRGVPKDLFVDTEITVDRPKQDAASADLNATKTLSHEEIFIAFGVPPSMAQAKAAFSMGKDSDRYQLITGTCQPLGRAICGALARPASQMAGVKLTAELDWDDHPVLVEVRNGRVETALKLWGVGMPMECANDFLGLGMKPFAGWDRGYLPFSVQPVDSPEPAPTADPALAEPADVVPTDPELASVRLLTLARMRCQKSARQEKNAREQDQAPDQFAVFACTCGAWHNVEHLGNAKFSAEHRTAWEAQMSKRRPTLKAFQSAFGRVLMQARAEVLRKIEAQKTIQSGNQELRSGPDSLSPRLSRSAAIDFLFDAAKFALSLRGAMERQHENALQVAGQQLFAELGKDDPFAYPPQEALRFIRERLNKLSGVPDEIHARIKLTLEDGLNDGDTMEQLAKRIRQQFNEIDEGRSRVIASTETGAAYGTARAQAMREAGVQWKAWLTSGNANVRAAHYEAGLTYSHDTPIPVDEPFIVDGESLMHPGDQSGSPRNTINCHCVAIAVARPEERKTPNQERENAKPPSS